MTDIGTLGGNATYALDINNRGEIVGESLRPDSLMFHAYRWSNGSMVDLGITQDERSCATAINNLGQIVGWRDVPGGGKKGWLYDGGLIEIGSLGAGSTYPNDINDRGEVVGRFLTAGFKTHAFLWHAGTMVDIGEPLGSYNMAYSINLTGDVVGGSPAFIYTDGTIMKLDTLIDQSLGWKLNEATGINDAGMIVGTGTHNGQMQAFLLVPARRPLFIVPGIAGTYAASTWDDLGWILTRGVPPQNLQIDPLGRKYENLIKTMENVGYTQGKDLFVVTYDWRLTPGPDDHTIDGHISGLSATSITDDQFAYGVDYLGWYIKKACEQWRQTYNMELDSIDVISHSTGGLVTRTYIQSDAYGGVYDPVQSYRLPKIRNFIMLAVPNRGASKAWNPLHDNWISDWIYRLVLSKIVNCAYQKVTRWAKTVTGPDHDITRQSILDSHGNPDKVKFINQYVPTIRGLLATYDFLDAGSGYANVNGRADERNAYVLDLNNGLDSQPGGDPNAFLDATQGIVIYGTGQPTFDRVQERKDLELWAVQSFSDWQPVVAGPGTTAPTWYKDLSSPGNGDGTVPTISAAGQFLSDSRAKKFPFSTGDHTGLVSEPEVQKTILRELNTQFKEADISISGGQPSLQTLFVLSDPVEVLVTDGLGRRLGFSSATGALAEIPNSMWLGNTEGRGYVLGPVQEPVDLKITGLGGQYYVMVSVEDSGNHGGTVLEGTLGTGEVKNYQITTKPLAVQAVTQGIPGDFVLEQNYPNPFNASTTIRYRVPVATRVSLRIYDLLGRLIATLVDRVEEPGYRSVRWDAAGHASGVYYYRLAGGDFVDTKKLLLVY